MESWRKAQGYVGRGGVERFENEVLTPMSCARNPISGRIKFRLMMQWNTFCTAFLIP
jgi:hypothetical protein